MGGKAQKRQKFEQLALAYMEPLYYMALRMTGEVNRAEDLVQDTYERAYRHFNQFEEGTNVKAWLFKILTNTFINQYRRRGKEPILFDFAEYEPAERWSEEGGYFTVDDIEAVKEHLSEEVRRALEHLPTEYRVVFLLSTLGGFSYKEISQILECPMGTVMSRLFRARDVMRQELLRYAREQGYVR